MNRSRATGFAFAAFIAIAMLFSSSAFSQLSLRNAMDIDNDGKADYSVFRPGNNAWYIFKSGGGPAYIQNFGLANDDFMAPGDYDGDGIGDIGVWRDTTGVWYWLKSSDNTLGLDCGLLPRVRRRS
jgi:hypothetical protein